MKLDKVAIGKIFVLIVLVAGIGYASANIGRFTPTHAIVEPVFCGSCHPDQVIELNATTHLPHFMGAIVEEAEAVTAGSGATVTLAESISGGCMMCHNTWYNRERIFVNGYEIQQNVSGTGNYYLKYNDIVFKPTNTSTMYDVIVTNNMTILDAGQVVRLSGGIVTSGKNAPSITVQDPSTSGIVIGTKLNASAGDYTVGSTNITLLNSTNVTTLGAANASVKITYTLTSNSTRNLKDMWGDLSAMSPTAGVFFNDQTGSPSCGNSEKGFCHAVEITLGKNVANQLPENKLQALGIGGSGNGIYFQHEMAYTSAEYAAKQVKLCGACHFNKLPPMDSDGNPIRIENNAPSVYRSSHGVIYQSNITTISSDWAHKQVQCIRCHGHAGIGPENGLTGVTSN